MEGMTTLRVDLGIHAKNIASQIMVENNRIEEQIAKGIQLALDELTEEDNFVELIKEGTKKTINDIVKSATSSWEFKKKIEKAISEKMSDKISEYAEGVANKVVSELQ